MLKSSLFHGGSLGRHAFCVFLSVGLFCVQIRCADAHGGGSGGSSSGSGSSGSSGSASSGGHGGPAGSMGGNSAGHGSSDFSGPGSGNSASGHGGGGHGSGHANTSAAAHGTTASHNATVAAAKNSSAHTQIVRNGFTSDTMLARSENRIRNRQVSTGGTSSGESTSDTQYKKRLKTHRAEAETSALDNERAR
jgi:hypothetical protein